MSRPPDPISILPASSHLEIKSFYGSRDQLAFHDACVIRYNVFVAEQGFAAENEFDEIDQTCMHLLAYYVSPAWGGRSVPVGTLRLHPLVNSNVVKLGRIAVMKPHRHQGIARRLISVAESVARSMGLTRCMMHAQADKRVLYEKLGYRVMEVDDNTEEPCGNEEIRIPDNGTIEGAGKADFEKYDRRGQFLEEGVWHVKMCKDILQFN